MTLNARSLKTLTGIHPDLVRVVMRADELGARFIVTDGLRSLEKQRELVRAGKSKTMKSRHLTGHAVDLCASHDDGVSWDADELKAIADIMKQAAAEQNVLIEWGGDWKGFVDMPHFQLPWKQYPADGPPPAEPKLAAAPAAPLKQSWTMRGAALGGIGGLLAVFEEAFRGLLDVGAAVIQLGPVQSAMIAAGANVKAISFGMLVTGIGTVISRRIKAKQEGTAG